MGVRIVTKTCKECSRQYEGPSTSSVCSDECKRKQKNARQVEYAERYPERVAEATRRAIEKRKLKRRAARAEHVKTTPAVSVIFVEPTGEPCARDGCSEPAMGDEFCSRSCFNLARRSA